MIIPDQRVCHRCGKKHLKRGVHLELNTITNRFHTPGLVPRGESQGLFWFGLTCARTQLAQDRQRKGR